MAAPTKYASLTTLQDVLREVLLPEVREQLPDHVLFLNFFKRTSKTVRRVGQDFKALMSVRTAHNQGFGMRAAGGALPGHGAPAYDEIEVTLKRMYGRGAIDRAVLSPALQGGVSNVGRVLDEEMASIQRTAQIELSRMLQGDGNGVLTQVNETDGTGDTFNVDDARYLEKGMILDSWTAKTAGTQHFNGVEISDVDYENDEIVLTASASYYNNDYLYREDNRGLECAGGLQAVVDDGSVVATFQGVSRAATSYFNGNLVDAGGDALELNDLYVAADKGRKRAGKSANFIGSDLDSQRYYSLLLESQRRQVNTTELKSGWTGLSFAHGGRNVSWFADEFFTPGYIYFLDTDAFAIFEAGPMDFVDNDGSILRNVSGYDIFEFYLAYYFDVGVDRCNSQTRLYNFTEPGA
uniref:Putative capsid protein n=1 Tax=viral metagenome TaxID=1070528 RepID=A0A6M3Y4K7_9ZZZZ